MCRLTNSLGIEQSRDPDRKGSFGNVLRLIEESSLSICHQVDCAVPVLSFRSRNIYIHDPRRLTESDDPGSTRESGSTLIECDMTILPNPAQEQIDPSTRFYLFFVCVARLLRCLGGPV